MLAVKTTPLGSAPLIVNTGFGTVFEALIVKVLAPPTTKVALFGLTILGGLVIVSVKFCVAAGSTPFDAVSTIA